MDVFSFIEYAGTGDIADEIYSRVANGRMLTKEVYAHRKQKLILLLLFTHLLPKDFSLVLRIIFADAGDFLTNKPTSTTTTSTSMGNILCDELQVKLT